MKNKKTSNKSPAQLKSRLMAALAMLLVASVLMGSTTYAWLVLSIAPEVTGITTNIGANGSLEIALLNTETRQNMSTIRSGKVGESLAARNLGANITWGNLVDLNDASYGLDNIVLMPARLDAVGNEDGTGYTVSSGLLSIPTYGYDGRVIDVTADAVSTVYNNGEFAYVPAAQTYGVRAIGTSENLTEQASALAMAKSNITTYTNSAVNAASGSLTNNGNALVNDIIAGYVLNPDSLFDDADLGIIKSMINDLNDAANYIDLALRQGLVAVVASVEGNQDNFVLYRNQIIDTENELSGLIDTMTEAKVTVPDSFVEWVASLDNIKNNLNQAQINCDALNNGSYTWEQLRGALDLLMNLTYVLINDTPYPEFDKSQAGELMGGDNSITLAPGSGVFADVADFAGNITAMVSTIMGNVEITTATNPASVYLVVLYESIKNLEAAGDATGTQSVALSNTYGYALDLAFRCSSESELLLQTAGAQRIYEDSASLATQGGGSYMEFAITDSVTQTILLMDAVRVAFVDDAGKLLGVAKLNTSNRQSTETTIKAPLYLYGFSFSEEDGSMVMGERKLTSNAITTLQRNVAKAVTVVVWLDGDLVDNSMVSGEAETSMSGMLNLQFASSADLVPARNTDLLNVTTNPGDLIEKIAKEKPTYEAGQLYYSSVSWNAYTAAYNRAVAVSQSENANGSQIWNAISELNDAKNALEAPSHVALRKLITDVRYIMGKTDDLISISIIDEFGDYNVLTEEYTAEQFKNRVTDSAVYHVDSEKNIRPEGDGLNSYVYTNESWEVLAGVLYRAEQLCANAKATEAEIDSMMTALDTAFDALDPGAYYFPYDYAGTLYYYGVPKSEYDDTYGKWFDANFVPVVSDRTILNLDAFAEPATVAQIILTEKYDEGEDFIEWNVDSVMPYVQLNDIIYPTFAGDEIIGLKMVRDADYFYAEAMNDTHIEALNALIKIVKDNELTVDITSAEEILKRETLTDADEAQNIIDSLTAEVVNALDEKNPSEPEEELVSADLITVMTKAVDAAQEVIDANKPGKDENGNDLPVDENIAALIEAKESVAALITSDNVLASTAQDALDKLNEQLVANDKDEVTIANTIPHSIPTDISDIIELVYTKEYPLILSGKTGETTLSVIGVTKKGVVFRASTDVKIYTAANLAEINDSVIEVNVGDTLDLSAYLMWDEDRSELEFKLGNAVRDEETGKVTITTTERSKTWTWASSDIKLATVSDGNSVGTVKGVKAGTVTIEVSIETDAGNVYTTSCVVTVNPKPEKPAEPEVTDPSEPEVTEPSEPEATDPSEPENP